MVKISHRQVLILLIINQLSPTEKPLAAPLQLHKRPLQPHGKPLTAPRKNHLQLLLIVPGNDCGEESPWGLLPAVTVVTGEFRTASQWCRLNQHALILDLETEDSVLPCFLASQLYVSNIHALRAWGLIL